MMKFYRKTTVFALLATMICLSSAFRERVEEAKPRHLSFLTNMHRGIQKPISIFSKPAPSEDAKKPGPGLLGHITNVINGGSINIEIRPLAPIHGILEHAKKVLPGGQSQVGKPSNEKPPPEKPSKEHWIEVTEKPSKEDWIEITERPRPSKEHGIKVTEDGGKDWEMKKPEAGGPNWGDIGEHTEDPGADDVPIEGIIQPRLKPDSRPRRYIESKIYYLPLPYQFDGRPIEVKMLNRKIMRNTIRDKMNL